MAVLVHFGRRNIFKLISENHKYPIKYNAVCIGLYSLFISRSKYGYEHNILSQITDWQESMSLHFLLRAKWDAFFIGLSICCNGRSDQINQGASSSRKVFLMGTVLIFFSSRGRFSSRRKTRQSTRTWRIGFPFSIRVQSWSALSLSQYSKLKSSWSANILTFDSGPHAAGRKEMRRKIYIGFR